MRPAASTWGCAVPKAQPVRPGEAHLELEENLQLRRRQGLGRVQAFTIEANRAKRQDRCRRARRHYARAPAPQRGRRSGRNLPDVRGTTSYWFQLLFAEPMGT